MKDPWDHLAFRVLCWALTLKTILHCLALILFVVLVLTWLEELKSAAGR